MKLWWTATLGVMMLTVAAYAAQTAEQQVVKDHDGQTVGVLLLCNDCKTGESKTCHGGAEKGWLDGKPCGQCLIKSNFGVLVKYAADLHVTGTLVDGNGKPVANRFVKMFLPNGWGTRTRTNDEGTFRLMMGATAERKGKEPLVVDIGTHVDSITADDPYFAMFLLPPNYNPCPADAMDKPTGAAKPEKAAKPAKKSKPAK